MTQNYSPSDYDIFVGIDVDKRSYAFTVKDQDNMKRSKKIPSSPEYFYNYLDNNYKDKKVICGYEAGPTGFKLYDYLNTKDISCLVVSPLSIPKAPNERVKTNRIDSDKLAHYLKSGDLKSIRVPEDEYRQLRHLVKIRQNYAYLRKASKQRINALLLSAGLDSYINEDEYSRWSGRYINELKKIPCTGATKQSLNMLLGDFEYARKQNSTTLKQLRAFFKDNKPIDQYRLYLQSIPGIGFIVAATTLGKIGNPENLRNPREIGSFAGLVPTEKSTGDDIKKGPITHLGDKIFRSLLVEAAWIAIRKDVRLKQFYHRIKRRHHHGIGTNKAITAVARKLTMIIYRVLKDKRMYVSS